MSSFKTEFSSDGAVVWTSFIGELTYQVVSDSYHSRYGDPERLAALRYVVADYTEMTTIALTTPDVREFAQRAVDCSQVNPQITLIGIMKGALQYGLSRMFDGWALGIQWSRHTVETAAEAHALIATLQAQDGAD